MTKYLKNIIIFLIQLIEKYEFRNIDKNEIDLLKKIVDIIPLKNKSVKSDYGFTPTSEIIRTIPLQRYELELENGNKLECADTHIVYCKNHIEKFVVDLTKNDYVLTNTGENKVKHIKKLRGKLSMFDLTIDGPEPSYYGNNILNHNTVSASIVLLHFVLFNNEKNCMIVANKGKTVKEIIRKIKEIYKTLPFFLKKGVINWNEKSLALENGSRIQSENRVKEPSIGFTIDLLYLDEFAKVPNNIIESYYGAVIPTVSSVKNSKIIITSTPLGYNLFHKLLTDAERTEDDPEKNMYEAMRVYWHQVAGRRDVRIFPLAYKMKEYKITQEELIEFLHIQRFNIYNEEFNNKNWICVKHDLDNDKTYIHRIRGMRININDKMVPLNDLCIITNWQEEETKLIGGENMFNQEYDLQFITSDKLLFTSEQMEKFKKDSIDFKHIDFKELNKRLILPYNNLKWLTGKNDIFDPTKIKDYHIFAAIDLGEGLAQDYSVLNIFRLLPKPPDLIEKTHDELSTIYEFFYLEQIGMFRVNNWSINEFAELCYTVLFELFDSEKVKVVLEYNTYGATLLSELIHIFNDDNNFSNAIFLRYKHKKDDKYAKVGMKITGGEQEASKKLLVKALQGAVKKQMIKLRENVNITEISKFSKTETPSGNFTYKCSGGHDDCAMTLVGLSSIFNHVQYKNMIDDLFEKLELPIKQLIEKYVFNKKGDDKVDYSTTLNNREKIYNFKDKKELGRYSKIKNKRFTPYKPNPWDNNYKFKR